MARAVLVLSLFMATRNMYLRKKFKTESKLDIICHVALRTCIGGLERSEHVLADNDSTQLDLQKSQHVTYNGENKTRVLTATRTQLKFYLEYSYLCSFVE
jgi:hypothetical protein